MNLIEIFRRFPDQQACIDNLEAIRFRNGAYCPLCGSTKNVRRKRENNLVGRWNCHDCKKSFNVLSGTVMQGTHLPLQKWFLAIALIINAKKSLSSYQLARDLELTQPSAWYIQTRIRAAMMSEQSPMLEGIIEEDRTYVAGKPKKANKKNDLPPGGLGKSKKVPVIGAVERSDDENDAGQVKAQVVGEITGKTVLKFIQQAVSPASKITITDESGAYRVVRQLMPHGVINHAEQLC